MENNSLVKINITHLSTGMPAVGYTVEITELSDVYDDLVTDENGDIAEFSLDMNEYIYVNIFVRDPEGDLVTEADSQYPLAKPQTVVHIEL